MKRNSHNAYWYLIPAFTILLIVIVYPVISVVIGSFFREGGNGRTFVGLQNYILGFKDRNFKTAILNNLKLFLCVPVLTVLSLSIAVILYDKVPAWRFYRSIVFIPFILAIPAVGIAFSYMMQYNGAINTALRGMGLDALAKDWLGNSKYALWSIAIVIIWKHTGFGVILFLSRFMSIDRSIFEAAKLDGVNSFQRFIYIMIPQSTAIIEFYVTISLIDMLSWVFNYVHVMTGGGPGGKTFVLEYLIYNKAFTGGNFGMALAYSTILLIIASFLVGIQGIIRRRKDA